jgi:tripartite ATP-independent transporter DctM subunit
MIFAGITGSAVADESALGPILIPAMEESGYHKSYAAALVAAAAVIGPIIPPSIIMVIYGALMNVSIAGMFAAGILPGLLIGAGLMIMNYFISRKRNYPKRDTIPTFREAVTSVMGAITALLMPLIILGGILGGIFTPTESAAIAVLYSLIVGFAVFRTLTVAEVYHALVATFRLCGVILIILSVGSVLSWLFAIDHVPEQLAKVFTALGGNNKYLIILILNIFLIIVGMFMDITAALIILAPILAPLATDVGMDPLHFGVMMCINLNIGLITPPVGACLFVATSISKLRYEEVIREVWPFILVEVGVLFLLAYVPPVTLYVPQLLGLAR